MSQRQFATTPDQPGEPAPNGKHTAQQGTRRKRRIWILSALLLLCIAGYPWISAQIKRFSLHNYFDGFVPEEISTNAIQYRGREVLAEDLEAAFEGKKDSLLTRLLQSKELAGYSSEELHFSDPFYTVVVADGNWIDRSRVDYLVLHEQQVVGTISAHSDESTVAYQWDVETGATAYYAALSALLQQDRSGELAMVSIGNVFDALVSPDGKLHLLNAQEQPIDFPKSIPLQRDDYYKLLCDGSNCITGID
ncbi:MAG: hypothetical protein IIY70_03605 [Oscillospiraceae bacterium]|nr:hypothetical protein [Oscillospiraceae bacterium]